MPELKKLIEDAEQQLKIRDMRIKVLEKYIRDNGLTLPDDEYIQSNKDLVEPEEDKENAEQEEELMEQDGDVEG